MCKGHMTVRVRLDGQEKIVKVKMLDIDCYAWHKNEVEDFFFEHLAIFLPGYPNLDLFHSNHWKTVKYTCVFDVNLASFVTILTFLCLRNHFVLTIIHFNITISSLQIRNIVSQIHAKMVENVLPSLVDINAYVTSTKESIVKVSHILWYCKIVHESAFCHPAACISLLFIYHLFN